MNGILIELPEAVREQVRQQAAGRQMSEAAFIEQAVQEKLASIDQLRYLEERARRGDRERFHRILAQAPAIEPDQNDRW